jgi:hypothetical protein
MTPPLASPQSPPAGQSGTAVITPPPLTGVTYSPTLLTALSIVGAILTQFVAFGIITNTVDQLVVAIAGPVVALAVLAYDVFVRHVQAKHALALAAGPLRMLEPMVAELGKVEPAAAPAINEAEIIARVAEAALGQVQDGLARAAATGHRPPLGQVGEGAV